MRKRRNILKSVGSLATISTFGKASANKKTLSKGNKIPSHALEKQLKNAVENNGKDGLKGVYEKHNIDYTETTSELPPMGEEHENEEIGTQDQYSESSSEITVVSGGYDDTDSTWITNVVDLDDVNKKVRTATAIDDVIGITYNTDHWSLVGNPHISISDSEGNVHDISWYSDSYRPGNGILAARVDIDHTGGINATLPSEGTAVMMAKLELQDDTPATVFGTYTHTRALAGLGSIESVSVDSGVIEVELSGTSASTAWEKAKPVDPSDNVTV